MVIAIPFVPVFDITPSFVINHLQFITGFSLSHRTLKVHLIVKNGMAMKTYHGWDFHESDERVHQQEN